ncbi:MAG: hypothetical protein KKH61_14595, partial [Gammaproteobacteria bacterium]|nr:hypothetical protein [Gammaproteobacteria bacterium]
ETTQQNAALVEEATAAARAMEEQAGHLTDAVALFKLEGQAHAAPAAVIRAPAPPRAAAPAKPRSVVAAPRRVMSREPALANDTEWQEF